ncbi:MAG: hypothetical protein FRX49_02792 [Trebouxia sp. A1-2]|nr:MAG: hypothetical protein FRX49_02792 [Trebouxia sp. A1-2]
MPSNPNRKRSMRSRPQASKHQQVFAAEDAKVRNEQIRKSTRGTSRAALAACGAKRKRKEAGGSDHEDTDGDYCPEEPNYVAEAAARTEGTGSDQHKLNTEKSARVRRSGRQTFKARAAEPQGQPSFASATSRRPVPAPAISTSRTADTVRQPLSPTRQGINRAATSAAFAAAAASFGKRKLPVADRPSSASSSLAGMIPSGTGVRLPKPSDQFPKARPPASQGAGPSGLASLIPPSQRAGLTGLASMVFQQHCRAGRPPKPPANQQLPTALVLAMQQSSGRATPSHPQLPVLSNPHGPASFPYFKEGFMTQPFSVSAFEAESKVAFAKLEDFLAEAAILQEQGEMIEAASLRVAPLEEQRQAAVQAVLAQTTATRRQASMRQASPGQTPATAAGVADGPVTPGSGNASRNPAAEVLSTSLVVAPPFRSTPAVTAESPASVAAARPGKEAQKKAEAEVKMKWQEGLDEAAKALRSVKLVSNPSSKAADKRWTRNLSTKTASTPAGETADRDSIQVSAAGSANLFSPATTRGPAQEPVGFQAVACSGHSRAKASQAEQAPLLPRPPDDVVLTFCIHRFDRPGWKLMDVAVLSSQKLTTLKDVIQCEADANMKSHGQDKPNGYFYIEGDFYNDMRNDGTDLSLNVRQFCRDRNISVPAPKPSAPPAYPPGSANAPYFSRSTQCEPRTKRMEDTTFNDLFLRVGQGAGYVYVHQGCCEHLLELTDVRRAHDADPLLINHYPQVLDQYTGYVAFPYRYELGTMKQQNRKDTDTAEDCNDED